MLLEEEMVEVERAAVGLTLGRPPSSDGGEEGSRSPFGASFSFRPFPDESPSPLSALLLRLTKIPSSTPSSISSPSSSHPCIKTPPAASPSSAANLEFPYALELSMTL